MGDAINSGTTDGSPIAYAGNTPACMQTHVLIVDAALMGDDLYAVRSSAREDFPGVNARTLYILLRKLSLPSETAAIHVSRLSRRSRAHCVSSVREWAWSHIHWLGKGKTEGWRSVCMAWKPRVFGYCRLILPSVQVIWRAGTLPPAAGKRAVVI